MILFANLDFKLINMTVRIFCLNEKDIADTEYLTHMLSKDIGPLKFRLHKPSTKEDYYKFHNSLDIVSVHDFNHISQLIENKYPFNHNFFNVILTEKQIESPTNKFKSSKDWYSFYFEKFIIVKTSGWEESTEGKPYLGVAHQIIENLFQSLGCIDLYGLNLFDSLHRKTKTCINDFCETIEETNGKIRSGHICKQCYENAMPHIGNETIVQIRSILRRIRNRITEDYEIPVSDRERKIEINNNLDIIIGGVHLDWGKSKNLHPYYLFYLLNYNKNIGVSDFKGEGKYNDAMDKMTELLLNLKFKNFNKLKGTSIGERLYKEKIKLVNSFIKNITSYQTRIYNTIMNNVHREDVGYFYRLTSKKIDRKNTYFVRVDSTDIVIPENFKKYIVSEV
jgi:hypothetical protein